MSRFTLPFVFTDSAAWGPSVRPRTTGASHHKRIVVFFLFWPSCTTYLPSHLTLRAVATTGIPQCSTKAKTKEKIKEKIKAETKEKTKAKTKAKARDADADAWGGGVSPQESPEAPRSCAARRSAAPRTASPENSRRDIYIYIFERRYARGERDSQPGVDCRDQNKWNEVLEVWEGTRS